ncbi:MAG: Crp/Fnr family transcriptional regulator [Imperialibacter sp.]|uniref:Crp/Fnr family transcriptional regulator n=1 Tax=Imperialibacter sp. TaxID=2038411 RepID=UPI003A8C893B
MIDFLSFCNRLCPLDKEASDDLLEKLKSRTIEKNDFILKRGEVCRHLCFVDEGLTKTFFTSEDKEFVMRFFAEHSMLTVLDSFVSEMPSNYGMLALEKTRVTYISKPDLEQLCGKHHCVETFFRKLVSMAAANMMKRVSEMLEDNATARYNHFVANEGQLLQRISLGDLSNYLGVTQVTLSRIRAKK